MRWLESSCKLCPLKLILHPSQHLHHLHFNQVRLLVKINYYLTLGFELVIQAFMEDLRTKQNSKTTLNLRDLLSFIGGQMVAVSQQTLVNLFITAVNSWFSPIFPGIKLFRHWCFHRVFWNFNSIDKLFFTDFTYFV